MSTQPFLDPKTQHLVALGAAVAGKCQICFAKLYGSAGDSGISQGEVRAVVAIASKVAEKSRTFMAEFVEEKIKAASAGAVRLDAEPGCG